MNVLAVKTLSEQMLLKTYDGENQYAVKAGVDTTRESQLVESRYD